MCIPSKPPPGEQRPSGQPEDRLARLLGRLAAQRWLRMQASTEQQLGEKARSTRQRRVTPSNAKE